ncbi:extracellular calcium-sensing receptor-like [Lepisosteus oculatus]|uniref:extracellular calcium-sensing receptor-like n=1 Tax=Lepisosteus oculatus TaxID=7918 RepID=UPI0035F523A8
MFPIHSKGINEEQTYQQKPGKQQCREFNFRAFRWMQAMIFFIEEVNRNKALLPNITLGYSLYDSCALEPQAVKATLSMLTEPAHEREEGCRDVPSVPVVIGNSGSSLTIAVSRALQPFRVPLVSYFASCACLSNKHNFPNVFRTIPSDVYQVRALAHLIHRLGWTWVGIIGSDDDYGYLGTQMFIEEVTKLGSCIAYRLVIPKVLSEKKTLEIVKKIKESTARAIVVFSIEAEIYSLIEEIAHQNITDRQWVASEAWVTSTLISDNKNFHFLRGTIGFALRKAEMPQLKDFLFKLSPLEKNVNQFVREFWETQFKCSFNETGTSEFNTSATTRRYYDQTCTGRENLEKSKSIYGDVSNLRVTYNIHKAVYAVAYALHKLQACEHGKGPFINRTCGDIYNLQSWQVAHYLKEINYTNEFGDQVYLDRNGEPVGTYDIINWQGNSDASIKFVTVGLFDASLPQDQQLLFHEEEIIWSGGKREVPRSACTESCPVGYRKAARVGQPVCCYDCVPCADGTFSNSTDQAECAPCPADFWSSGNRTGCVVKDTEYLSYSEGFGTALATVAVSGAAMTTAAAAIFLRHRDTPIVRANNSELSFLLLFSLMCCFLCALTFVGQPTEWTCCLRRTSFGLSFALCLSCLLSKTVVVLMAFKAALPGNKVTKWFGPLQQRLSVFACAAIQIALCSVWLTVSPPFPVRNTWLYKDRIILECNLGSVALFCCVLGYIGCLACFCFVLAFLARKLPGNFNEAKLITFSMLIFCAVWISFIPAYVSSPGKYTVAVEIFAILSSSFGVLFCIFIPKCYIIIFLPERNSKKFLMSQTRSVK